MTKNWKYALLISGLFSFSSAMGQSAQEGRRLLDMERYPEAKKTLSAVVKNQNTELNNILLGDAYLKAGQTDSAVMYYNIAAGLKKKSPLGYAAAGKAALVKNNKAEAEKQFNSADKRGRSKDANVLITIGSAYAHIKDYNKAVEYLNRAVQADPKNAPAFVMLGDAYLELKRGGEAMTAYEKAIAADSKYVLAHLRKGQLSVRSRNYNEAQNSYQAVIAADPNYAPAYRDLGELYYFAGKYDLALENYKKYVAMSENTPETRAVYASFLYLTKDYEGTLKEAQEVLKAEPNNVVMKRLMAYSLYETKQDDKAAEAIADYFRTTPADKLIASDYEYQGKILARTDKNDEALNSFNKAFSMDSSRADLLNDIAQIYVKQNNFPKAIALYRNKMASSQPTNTDYYYLGNLYDQSKDYKAADSLYALITTNNPTFALAHIWRARANANLDPETKTGLAKPHYEKYIELASEEKDKNKAGLVEANYYLAYYNYLQQDKAKANAHLKEVLALDPGNTQAKTLSDVVNGKVKAKTKTKTKR